MLWMVHGFMHHMSRFHIVVRCGMCASVVSELYHDIVPLDVEGCSCQCHDGKVMCNSDTPTRRGG